MTIQRQRSASLPQTNLSRPARLSYPRQSPSALHSPVSSFRESPPSTHPRSSQRISRRTSLDSLALHPKQPATEETFPAHPQLSRFQRSSCHASLLLLQEMHSACQRTSRSI